MGSAHRLGGKHLWFVVSELKLGNHLAGVTGIDAKHGDNGFVVAPASIHPNGGVYEWLTPPVGEPAMAPGWLLTLLAPPVYDFPATGVPSGGHGIYTAECLVRRIEAAREGTRNLTVFGACRDAAKQGDLDVFEDALFAAGVACGLSPAEVAGIVRSARKAGA